MERQVDTVLLGASFYAIGYAASHAESLIVEETEILGNDYEGHFRVPICESNATFDQISSNFRSFLQKKGVISDSGHVDILSLATVICAYVKEKHLPILLDSFLVSAEKQKIGYRLSIFTNGGIYNILTKNLIDTTALRISQRDNLVVKSKYLSVLCFRPSEDFTIRLREVCPGCDFFQGFFPEEWFIRFSFDCSASLPMARDAVYNWWRQAFPHGESLIDCMSFDFDVKAVSGSRPDFCCWVPPYRHSSPLGAFADGCRTAYEKGAGQRCITMN